MTDPIDHSLTQDKMTEFFKFLEDNDLFDGIPGGELTEKEAEEYLDRKCAEALNLKPFKSDGCTLWPDLDYKNCCDRHDHDYWIGGSYYERLRSDRQLRDCVATKGEWYHPIIARLMFIGVRIGGAFFWPVRWRWGWGHKWPKCQHGIRHVSSSE